MKSLFSKKLMGAAALVLLLVLSVSADALAQGRGRGRGRGFDEGLGRKCGKFVNCHDARDGRWDGRGPRRNVSLSDRIWRRHRRNRDRDRDFDRITRHRRNRDYDRDWRRR